MTYPEHFDVTELLVTDDDMQDMFNDMLEFMSNKLTKHYED